MGNIAAVILPDAGGLLNCKKEFIPPENIDVQKTVPLIVPEWDSKDNTRYGDNHNRLEDLAAVYHILDEGKSVLTALNSPDAGELVVLVYGYTALGDLLLADSSTKTPVGVLRIKPECARRMDAEGNIDQMEWYTFSGCGFDSSHNDRIYFMNAGILGKDFK